MHPSFNTINSSPENEVFKVVFFPDRIYHDKYFNATVSSRYNYNVNEVRNKHDITFLKAQVFQDGIFLANVLRIEYGASRLFETSRENNRTLNESLICNLTLIDSETNQKISAQVKLNYCDWIRAFQCEIWDNIDPINSSSHHFKVLSQMGRFGSIVTVPQFETIFQDLKKLKQLTLNFEENDIELPLGYHVNNPSIDNNYMRSFQVPTTDVPSSDINTVRVDNYMINFQKGWFLDSNNIKPVRYSNAMMESVNPNYRTDGKNIVEMKWILQEELGGSIVYFHEVNVTPGSFEGVHQHIGSEELYYIVSGEGIAYMGDHDDPALSNEPIVLQEIFCIGQKPVREVHVKPGKIIYTKSGGIHGIRNTSDTEPLIFVAFGYHCS